MSKSPTQTTKKTTQPVRTPTTMILFLLLVFPPVAWFLMWIDKTYHHWFAKLLMISGLFSLGYLTLSYVFVGTQLNLLYESLGVQSTNQEIIKITAFIGVLFAILQVGLGYYLLRVVTKKQYLDRGELFITVLLLAASAYVAFIPMLLIVQDIYAALAKLYMGPY